MFVGRTARLVVGNDGEVPLELMVEPWGKEIDPYVYGGCPARNTAVRRCARCGRPGPAAAVP